MRKLIWLVLLAGFLWGGYWFIGSRAVESGLAGWLEDRQKDGWVAEYSDLQTRGFPNRFDTTITNLELADPNTGVAWVAPLFQILALSYKPHHIIAILPEKHSIASPHERITIENETMRGSVVFEPDTSLALERLRLELKDLTLTSDRDWTTHIQIGQLSTQQSAGTPNSHDIYFEASGVKPSRAMLKALDPAGVLPNIFEKLEIDSKIGFTAPWNRFAIEKARPQITAIGLKLLQANWGDLDLHAAGELLVDDLGLPTGTITVRAQNWRQMLAIATSAGVVPQNIALTVERALEFVAGMSGNPETIDAPLSFANGRVSFGPIPLGRAPRIDIR